MIDYSTSRTQHLTEIAAADDLLKDAVGGTHQNGDKQYGHIIKVPYVIDKQEQLKLVIKHNLLPGVDPDMLRKKREKLHSMAHYLNSSQIMCYNFFRPLLTDKHRATRELCDLLEKKGIHITEDAEGEFEYNPCIVGRDGRREQTEIDFSLKDPSGVEVFFEIKYTEKEFGKWTGRGAREENFLNFYADRLRDSSVLKNKPEQFGDAFCQDFQLFRNALCADSSRRYSIVVFPEDNRLVADEWKAFCEKYVADTKHMQAYTWEELIRELQMEESAFYRKYMAE